MSAGETDITRREVIVAGAAVASLAAPGPGQALAVPFSEGQNEVPLALHVNGVRHDLNLEPRVILLDTLRERLNLCGTKKGCDIGQCGACTVHIDGHRVLSCLTLAVQAVAAALVELFATASSAKPAVAVDALRRLRNGGRTVPSVSHNLTPANLGPFVTARPVARAPDGP